MMFTNGRKIYLHETEHCVMVTQVCAEFRQEDYKIHKLIHIHANIHPYTPKYTHTPIHQHTHTPHIPTPTYAPHTHTPYTHTYIHTYTHPPATHPPTYIFHIFY